MERKEGDVEILSMEAKYAIKETKSQDQLQEEAAAKAWDAMTDEQKKQAEAKFREAQIKNMEEIEQQMGEAAETFRRIADPGVQKAMEEAKAAAATIKENTTPSLEAKKAIDDAAAAIENYQDAQMDMLIQAAGENIKILNAAVCIYRSLAFADFEWRDKTGKLKRRPCKKTQRHEQLIRKWNKIKTIRRVIIPREVMDILKEFAEKGQLKKGHTCMFGIEDMQNGKVITRGGKKYTVIEYTLTERKSGKVLPGEEFPHRRARQLFTPSNQIAANLPPFIGRKERESYLNATPMLDQKMTRSQAIARVKLLYESALLYRIDAMNIYDTLRICTTEELIAGAVRLRLDMANVEVFGRCALTDFSMHNLWTPLTAAEAKQVIHLNSRRHEELIHTLETMKYAENSSKANTIGKDLIPSFDLLRLVMNMFASDQNCLLRFDVPDLGFGLGDTIEWQNQGEDFSHTRQMDDKTVTSVVLRWVFKQTTAASIKCKNTILQAGEGGPLVRAISIQAILAEYKTVDPTNPWKDKLTCVSEKYLYLLGPEAIRKKFESNTLQLTDAALITPEELFTKLVKCLTNVYERVIGM
jgi:hypothetical protein